MRQEQDHFSQKSLPEKRKITKESNQNLNQNIDDQNSQSINFLTQPMFLKLRNLTNIPQGLHLANEQQIELLLKRISELQAKVEILQKKIRYKKKKRIRRTSQQIIKRYLCETCNKKYGSLVSRNLHLRLKHGFQIPQDEKNIQKTAEKIQNTFQM